MRAYRHLTPGGGESTHLAPAPAHASAERGSQVEPGVHRVLGPTGETLGGYQGGRALDPVELGRLDSAVAPPGLSPARPS